MSDHVELRSESRSVELRDAEVKGREFRGYAAVFDTPWNDRLIEATGYVEKVARGVFRKVLAAGDDVPLLMGHQDRHQILARTGSGTLRLQEDGRGLLTTAKLPDNYLGEYAREMIERGDIKGMSYGISLDPKRDTLLTRGEGGVYTRTVSRIAQLLDVSLTWEPAYSATSVELRTAGFVAAPLQELLDGAEAQTEAGGNGAQPPDDGSPEAWRDAREDAAAEAEGAPQPRATRRYWDLYFDQLERED